MKANHKKSKEITWRLTELSFNMQSALKTFCKHHPNGWFYLSLRVYLVVVTVYLSTYPLTIAVLPILLGRVFEFVKAGNRSREGFEGSWIHLPSVRYGEWLWFPGRDLEMLHAFVCFWNNESTIWRKFERDLHMSVLPLSVILLVNAQYFS